MFGNLKRIADSVQGLWNELSRCGELLAVMAQESDHDEHLEARVTDLERRLSQAMAEAEALTIKAESRFKAARAAEERERAHREKAEEAAEQLAGLDEEELASLPPEYLNLIQRGDVGGGEAEGMQPMRSPVADGPTGKERAKALKWGRV